MNTQVLKDNDQVTAAIAPADAKGFAIAGATFDAPPVWAISDETVATIAPSSDGTSCVISAAGNPGASANLSVTASVGGQQFSAQAALNIVAGDLASLAMAFGSPGALPAAAPAAAAPAAPVASS